MKKEILELQLKNTETLENVVERVQMRVTQLGEREYYMINLPDPDPVDFVPFENIDDATVLDWVAQNKSDESIKKDFIAKENRKANIAIKTDTSFTVRDHVKPWATGVSYQPGDKVYYEWTDNGEEKADFFEVVQAHTSQAGWQPNVVAALFTNIVYFGDEGGVGYPPWQQPQGAHDAYEAGRIVTHNDTLYISDIPANVWEPPTEWSVYDPNAPETPVEPVGNQWEPGVQYVSADIVEYNNIEYICISGHTSQVGWEPDVANTLWNEYSSSPAPTTPAEWVQPTGGHDAYNIGDQVTYNGSTWESNVDGNVWAPPTQWTEIV